MKVQKGEFGYIKAQKKKRTLITIILFAIPLLIFFTGLYMTKTRLNLFTFVAVMGCLPASRSAVGMVMMLMQKPMDTDVYQQIQGKAGALTIAYELVISAYEKHTPLDAIAVCGKNVIGYASNPKADIPFAQKHMKEILNNNGYQVNIKIFKDMKLFLDRLSTLNQNGEKSETDNSFQPDGEDTEISKNEMIKRTLLAISL